MKLWLLFLFAVPRFFPHPIHIAITEVDYNSSEKSLQIAHKIFVDDLEKHIQSLEKAKGNEVALHLNSAKENAKADAYIQAYLDQFFKLQVNDKVVNPVYLGKEYEAEAVWIYEEVTEAPAPQKIKARDRILSTLYEDQSNFIHFTIGGVKKSLRFQKGDDWQMAQW